MLTGLFFLVGNLSCTNIDNVPYVDFYIDLADPQYSDLTYVGGYEYVNDVLVFKALDFQYYALQQYCTSDGCAVQYQAAFHEVVCPCDQVHYDIYGNIIMGPSVSPLYQYATSLTGTLLRVYTP